mgnify:CR=1 FL=1
MSPTDPARPETQRQPMLVIWFAFLMSAVMYFLVIQLVPFASSSPNSAIDIALLLLAASSVATSFRWKQGVRRRQPEADAPNPKRERARFIISLALCDAAVILGLVDHFVTGSPNYFVMILLGIAGILLHFPRQQRVV